MEIFDKIYHEKVLPKLEEKRDTIQNNEIFIKRKAEVEARLFFSDDKKTSAKGPDDFNAYWQLYLKNMTKYKEEVALDEQRFAKRRPSRQERQKLKDMKFIISYMEQNKERIITDLVINSRTLAKNTELVRDIISGPKGIFNSDYISQFEKLTLKNKDERQAFLVVGGAASGKGSITDLTKKSNEDSTDLVEVNPDLYKKILLPLADVGKHIELHGSLTHAESSIVFDKIVERWQEMANSGLAPNILMDVARAGNWQLGVLSTGGTTISAGTPVLPIDVALKRSYRRGEQTGRFMPTAELIQGHKEQPKLNINAMKKGVNYKFYDTNVVYGEPTPLIAEYQAKKQELNIYNILAMCDYFSKDKLNPNAYDEHNLSDATPKSIFSAIEEHSSFADIKFYDKDTKIASIDKGKKVLNIHNLAKLVEQMKGIDSVAEFFKGALENQFVISGDQKTMQFVKALHDKMQKQQNDGQQNQDSSNSSIKNIEVEKYAMLLESLVNEGIRVGKTENIYIYDFANDVDLADKKLTIKTKNLDVVSEDAKKESSNTYDPEQPSKKQMLLIIDSKVYPTEDSRNAFISEMRRQLKENSSFTAEGVYMTERRKVNDDYEHSHQTPNGVMMMKPNPEAVRIAFKIRDEACRIPVQWDADGYAIEKDGAIVVREKDLPELKESLRLYHQDKSPGHILETDGRAKFDVYGTDPFFVEDNYYPLYSAAKYREFVSQLVESGEVAISKNAANHENVLGIQLNRGEHLVTPQGQLLTEGSWLVVAQSKVNDLRSELDKDGDIASHVYPMRNETIQKSFSIQGKSTIVAYTKSLHR